MISDVARLTRWEWFKLRRRWMPWVLLLPLIIIPQIWLWAEFFAYRSVDFYGNRNLGIKTSEAGGVFFSCVEIDEGNFSDLLESLPTERRKQAIDALPRFKEICDEHLEEESRLRVWHSQVFVPPGGLANGLAVMHFVGMLLVIILSASMVGTEYGLGTLRTVLARGVDRWRLLASKALLLALVAAAALAVALAPLYASALVATSLVPAGMELAEPGRWSTVLVILGKVLFALFPYIALGMLLTILTSSATFGIALAIGYIFAEGVVISFLGARFDRFDWFQGFLDLMIGPAVSGWLAEPGVRATGQDAAFFPLDKVQSNLRAFFVILAYLAALGAASTWLFQRKDVPGAKGD